MATEHDSLKQLGALCAQLGVAEEILGESVDPTTTLQEGFFATFVKKLAGNTLEDEIQELRNDIKDIKTPEQRKLLLIRCVRLLRQAVIMRHNWSPARKYINGAIEKFTKMAKGDPIKVINNNLRDAIGELTHLRDKILDMKVRGSEDFEDGLRKQIRGIEDTAASETLSDSDF